MVDYEVLNAAIDDILLIVNSYKKSNNVTVEIAEKLLLVLFGYYVSFGPQIFDKIQEVLECLRIYECEDEMDCLKTKRELIPEYPSNDCYPGTMWDYHYAKSNNEFIGAIPTIVYYRINLLQDVFVLVHELSHTLEGCKASVIYEDENLIKIKQCFSEYTITKNKTGFKKQGIGMTEFVTVAIENRILSDLVKLDAEQINNVFVRDFLSGLRRYKSVNSLLDSYSLMSGAFKDLLTSDIFFELIKKYYFENEIEIMIEEFDALGNGLSLERIIKLIELVYTDESNAFSRFESIHREMKLFRETTGVEEDKRLILVI